MMFRPGLHVDGSRNMAKLLKRFKVQAGGALTDGEVRMHPDIFMVTDADRLMAEPQAQNAVIAVAANGGLKVFTVPAGERWVVRAMHAFLSTGTYTFTEFKVRDGQSGVAVSFEQFTAASSYATLIPTHLELRPADELHLNISGFSVAGDVTARAWVEVIEFD